MVYPTLLLYLDDDAHAAARIEQAARLARRLESHLMGLSCRRPATGVPGPAGALLGLDALSLELQRASALAQAREEAFLGRCAALQVASFESIVDDDEPVRAITRHARCADLVVLGQPDPAEAGAARRQ